MVDILRHIDYERFDVDLLLLERLGDYAHQLPAQVHVILRPLQNTYGPLVRCLSDCVRKRDWFSLKMRLTMLAASRLGQKHIALARNLLLGDRHYDCAIGFRPGICTQVAAFASDAERRITWWHHGEINIGRSDYLESSKDCDAVAVVSDSCRAMLSREFPELADKMVTIHNMLDTDEILRRAEPDPYSGKSVRHIVSVGRLSPEKHFDNAIRAAKALKDRRLPFCCASKYITLKLF